MFMESTSALRLDLPVEGMTCAACAIRVERSLNRLPGVVANVNFAATCGGAIGVNGSGTGTLSGSTLDWNANGLVSQGGVNCPFTFSNGKATQDSGGTNVVVTYSGTVCGIPVSGTETVKR